MHVYAREMAIPFEVLSIQQFPINALLTRKRCSIISINLSDFKSNQIINFDVLVLSKYHYANGHKVKWLFLVIYLCA